MSGKEDYFLLQQKRVYFVFFSSKQIVPLTLKALKNSSNSNILLFKFEGCKNGQVWHFQVGLLSAYKEVLTVRDTLVNTLLIKWY